MRAAYSRVRDAYSRVRDVYSKVRDTYSRVRDAYSRVNLMSLLGSLWAYEGGFGVTIGSLRADRHRMALVVPIVWLRVRPKRVPNQKILISAKDFDCQENHEGS